MTKTERTRRQIIARILAVNDLCRDEPHRKAMRAVVMAAVNEGIDALTNNKARQDTKARRPKRQAKS